MTSILDSGTFQVKSPCRADISTGTVAFMHILAAAEPARSASAVKDEVYIVDRWSYASWRRKAGGN